MPTREEIRAKALADPNTKKIAYRLHLPLEEYVEMIVEFALNPKAEPEFVSIRDEDLVRLGAPPPNLEEMKSYLKEAVALANAGKKTEFQAGDKKKKPMELEGARNDTSGIEVEPGLSADDVKRRVKGGGTV